MSTTFKFETPENVSLECRPAGLGTRFVAWFVDNIILHVLMFVVFILLAILGALSDGLIRQGFDKIGNLADERMQDRDTVIFYIIGFVVLVWSFSSFLYFSLSEFWMRGQTFGKRACKIRVVKGDGFALDAAGVLLRNLFRVIDHLPPLWLVPLTSPQARRLGDIAAGTLVISDDPEELSDVRQLLAQRTAADAKYRFDQTRLAKLNDGDFGAVEQILDRWATLAPAQRVPIAERIVGALCRKMQVDAPPPEDRQSFLQDLLAAEFRRQDRRLK